MEIVKAIENIKNNMYSKVSLGTGVLSVIIIIFILTKYLTFDKSILQGVVLIVIAISIIELYLKHTSSKLTDLNKITLYKMYSIQKSTYDYVESQRLKNPKLTEKQIQEEKRKQKLEYLYIDANLINFLYDISYFNNYNKDVYFLLVKTIDNILKLRYMIEYYYKETNKLPENCYVIHEQINIEIMEAMNYMHSFIFSVPKVNMMYKQHKELQYRLFALLKRHSEFVRLACELKKKQDGINNDTKMIYKTKFPRGILSKSSDNSYDYENSYEIYV